MPFIQISDLPLKSSLDDTDVIHVKNSVDGIDYRVSGRVARNSKNISVSNTGNQLNSKNVQAALDEMADGSGFSGSGSGYYKKTDGEILYVGPGGTFETISEVLSGFSNRVNSDIIEQRRGGLIRVVVQPGFEWSENVVVSGGLNLSFIEIVPANHLSLKTAPGFTGAMISILGGAIGPMFRGNIDLSNSPEASCFVVKGSGSTLYLGNNPGVPSSQRPIDEVFIGFVDELDGVRISGATSGQPIVVDNGGKILVSGISDNSDNSPNKGVHITDCLGSLILGKNSEFDLAGSRLFVSGCPSPITVGQGSSLRANRVTYTGVSGGDLGLSVVGGKVFCGDLRLNLNASSNSTALKLRAGGEVSREAPEGSVNHLGYLSRYFDSGQFLAGIYGVDAKDASKVDTAARTIEGIRASSNSLLTFSQISGTISVTSNTFVDCIVSESLSTVSFRDTHTRIANGKIGSVFQFGRISFDENFTVRVTSSETFNVPINTLTTSGVVSGVPDVVITN